MDERLFFMEIQLQDYLTPPRLFSSHGAHSYDLLCHEGIARSLLVFQSKSKPPVYKTVQPPNGQALQKMIVKAEVI